MPISFMKSASRRSLWVRSFVLPVWRYPTGLNPVDNPVSSSNPANRSREYFAIQASVSVVMPPDTTRPAACHVVPELS